MLQTRKPTGKPSWPIVLLAGREKAGKSWAAVSASASPLIGRTLYVGIGEDDPDEYSLIPGADFDIVLHDGTYRGILGALKSAVAEPQGENPTMIIVDSMSRLWSLIQDNMQEIANQRAKGRRNAASGDYTISTDLWNVAAGQWADVMDVLRAHRGPVLLTARLDSVAIMENGQPTTQKEWKVQAHKTLVFDVAAVVEMRERGKFLLTGVKSARMQLDKPVEVPEFTIEKFWSRLGLEDGTGERAHSGARAESADPAKRPMKENWVELAGDARSKEELRPVYQRALAAQDLDILTEDGRPLAVYLRELGESLPETFVPEPVKKPRATKKAAAEEKSEPVTEWPTATIPGADKAPAPAATDDDEPF